MNRNGFWALVALLIAPAISVASESFTYAEIAKRYQTQQLSQERIVWAKMQGECLVGLKELNFRTSEEFDPVAEWTNGIVEKFRFNPSYKILPSFQKKQARGNPFDANGVECPKKG